MDEFVEVTLPDGRKVKVNKKNLKNYQSEVASSRKPVELPEFTIAAIKSKKPTLYDKSKEELNSNKEVISNTGSHTFNHGRDVNKLGKEYNIPDGPVTRLTKPTFVPKYKHTQYFLLEAIKNGK